MPLRSVAVGAISFLLVSISQGCDCCLLQLVYEVSWPNAFLGLMQTQDCILCLFVYIARGCWDVKLTAQTRPAWLLDVQEPHPAFQDKHRFLEKPRGSQWAAQVVGDKDDHARRKLLTRAQQASTADKEHTLRREMSFLVPQVGLSGNAKGWEGGDTPKRGHSAQCHDSLARVNFSASFKMQPKQFLHNVWRLARGLAKMKCKKAHTSIYSFHIVFHWPNADQFTINGVFNCMLAYAQLLA